MSSISTLFGAFAGFKSRDPRKAKDIETRTLAAEQQCIRMLSQDNLVGATKQLGRVANRSRTASLIKLATLYDAQGKDMKAQRLLQQVAREPPVPPEDLADMLTYAVGNSAQMTKFLLGHGANIPDDPEEQGRLLDSAIHRGNWDAAESLLAHGAKPQDHAVESQVAILDGNWRYALMERLIHAATAERRQAMLIPALERSSSILVNELIKLGATWRADGSEGAATLRAALRSSSTWDKAKRFLKEGARYDGGIADVNRYLETSIACPVMEALRRQLGPYASLDDGTKSDLDKLLVSSIRAGDGEVRKSLLDWGVPVDGDGSQKDAPLDVALNKRSWRAVEDLLSRGADANLNREGGRRILLTDDEGVRQKLRDAVFKPLPKRNRKLWQEAETGLPKAQYLQLVNMALHKPAELKQIEKTIEAAWIEPTGKQLKALETVRAISKKASNAATKSLETRAKDLDFSIAQLNGLRAYVMNEAPLTINFPLRVARNLAEDMVYKNQFSTHSSLGLLSYTAGGARDRWERKLFKFDGTLKAQDRPCYGSVNAPKARKGAMNYGDAMLVLKDNLRKYVTITAGDSGDEGNTTAGTLSDGIDHVLLKYDTRYFRAAMSASQGKREHRMEETSYRTYLEMQVHTQLRLSSVLKKVVLNRELHTTSELKHLKKIAEQANARFTWHGTLRNGSKRRQDSLNTIHKHHWRGQVWTYTGGYDYFAFAKFDPDTSTEHEFYDVEEHGRMGKLTALGEKGLQVVGASYNVDTKTSFFMTMRPKHGVKTPMEYLMETGASPLSLAQKHESAGYVLRGISKSANKGQWSVVLGRLKEGAKPVVHGMAECHLNAETLNLRFDNAYSHGKQLGTVSAILPVDSDMSKTWVYYFNNK